MVKNDMSIYKELFLVESKEHLQSLNNSLLAIEQNPDEIKHLNEMFRAAHTLKGMASTMGYTNISELAHKMENELDCLRGIKKIDKKNIDILFKWIDTLELFINAVASGKYIEEKKQNKLIDRELTEPNEKNCDKDDTKIVPTIRVNIKRLQKLQNLVEELAIAKLRLLQTASKFELSELNEISTSIDRLTSELQEKVFEMRLFPVDYLFSKFPRLVRDLGKKNKKEIDLIIEGSEIELDRLVLDEIDAAVLHLLRNSVDHGIEYPDLRRKIGKDEKGKIILAAKREGNFVIIEVSDDGKGLDLEAIKNSAINLKITTEAEASKLSDMEVYELLGTPGLSTSETITDVSGRGVGFNVVTSKVRSLGGNVKIESKKGNGTKIELRLPLTTAIIRSLLIEVASEKFALPLESVKQIVPINEKELKSINKKEVFNYRGQVLPLLRLGKVLNIARNRDDLRKTNDQDSLKINPGICPVVILEKNEKTFGLMVDSLLGQQETVVKPLSGIVQDMKEFAGATILGDGTVALIIDVGGLI